jgi:hypothetical protein
MPKIMVRQASNKIIIKIIQKKIDQKPRRWHSVLNEALWAYRMAPHGATKTSPYELVYGHHAILPWEIQSDSRRVVLQKDLSSKDYSSLMMDELEDLHMIRLRALEFLETSPNSRQISSRSALNRAGVAIGVARAGGVGIVGRPRGVAHHGWSRGRRRSGVPLDEPGDTKRIVRNKKKSIKVVKKLTITSSGERQRGSPRPRRWPGACCYCLPLGFWGH